jgi:hypothetical protein
MPKFLTVADNGYARGMNTVDDPKILQGGECVEIVNALPGYPLVVRKGCAARTLEYAGVSIDGSVAGKPFYAHFGGLEILFFWLRGESAYRLLGVTLGGFEEHEARPVYRTTADELEPLEIPADTDVNFDFVRIKNIVYTRASDGRMFAIEWYAAESILTARAVPNSETGVLSRIKTLNSAETPDGGHIGKHIYGYSITLVRRTDLPTDPTVYNPGRIEHPEIVSTRESVVRDAVADTAESTITVAGAVKYADAREFGYTHVRLYRTANLFGLFGSDGFMTGAEWAALSQAEKENVIKGAERYFLVDIPISDTGAFSFDDDITDGSLSGEMNLLTADMYTMPPADGYRMLYHKDRLFILGSKGSVYFSEIPGGDGGGNLEYAQLNVDKYALWFKPLHYRLDLDAEEQTPAAGIRALNDDLFFFKGDSVFMVVNGDPLAAPLRKINDMFGCPFPDTITNAIVGGAETLFYLSGAGPVLVHTGGNYKPFTEFKVRGLWGHVDGELLRVPRVDVEWCSAAFWNDTVWVFYKLRDRAARIYGCLSRENASGAFGVEIGGSAAGRYAPRGIAVTDANRAVTVCANGSGTNMFVDFMGAAGYDDELGEGLSARVAFKLYSRLMYPGPKERSMSELFRAVTYCDFDGADTFSLVVFNNRYSATFDYSRDGKEGPHFWENDMPHPIANLRRCITFTLPADFVGEYFQYMVEKTVPPDGRFLWYGVEMEGTPPLRGEPYPTLDLQLWRAPVRFAACPTQPFNAVKMLKSKSMRYRRGGNLPPAHAVSCN